MCSVLLESLGAWLWCSVLPIIWLLLLDALVFAFGTKLKTPVFNAERLLLELPVWKYLRNSVLFF